MKTFDVSTVTEYVIRIPANSEIEAIIKAGNTPLTEWKQKSVSLLEAEEVPEVKVKPSKNKRRRRNKQKVLS